MALNLVAHWSFDRVVPSIRSPLTVDISAAATAAATSGRPRSPTTTRSALGLHLARAPSLVIDMEIPSLPATRPTSPGPPAPISASGRATPAPDSKAPDDPETTARKTGLGTLMKSAKKDVQVAEFDMSAFF